jgi:c-di-GMP-binding flagellar brake protein YcgR
MSHDERRQYRRVQAPVFCRPVLKAGRGHPGQALSGERQQTVDISLGGLRMFSENEVQKGTHFELELFLPDRATVLCKVCVMWIERLPAGSPSNYDVGLKYDEIDPRDVEKLAVVLDES